MKSSCTPER